MKEKYDRHNNRRGFWLAMDFVFQVGLLIALPLVFFAWLGNMVDERINIAPLFFISGLIIGLLVGSYGVFKKVKEILKEI